MTVQSSNAALQAYANSLRNPAKKAYALAVIAYGAGSTQAEQSAADLGVMARQAVRMNIYDIEAEHRSI